MTAALFWRYMMSERKDVPFTNEHFISFCEKMVGQPYWYGTCVYKCTQSILNSKTAQYPSHYGSGRTSRYKEDIAQLTAFSLPVIEACVCLLYQVSAMAVATKKARMKSCDMSNPKYQMRSWLLRLGFIGERFERPRRTLLEQLNGNAAFFDDAGKQKARDKRMQKKAMALV